MNFVTVNFVLFFLPVLCIGWALRAHRELYKWFLITAGLVFYSFAGPAYLFLLLTVALLNWSSAYLMPILHARGRRVVITSVVTAHILLLAYYKYYEFAVLNLIDLAGFMGVDAGCCFSDSVAGILLPVGLSFYIFQGLSYSIDRYRNPQLPPYSFADVLAYVSFFPTLLAGPILRENDFFPQLTNRAGHSDFNIGMAYILSGLFKKVVLASYLSQHIVDGVFSDPHGYTSVAVLMGVYAYAVQIYCDFSGYTDLAIGVGRLLGFRLPTNFNAPYRAVNLQDFWHRWHITLSRWLRDYVYIPMGGNRRGNRYVNLILTMLIGGLWHGSGWMFLIWGTMHGVGLAVVHAFLRLKQRLLPAVLPEPLCRGGSVLAWLLTLHFVALLWIFFRAETPEQAFGVLRCLISGSTEGNSFTPLIVIATLCGLLLQFTGPWIFSRYTVLQSRFPWYIQACIVALLGGLIMNMGPEGMLPFIYFNF